MASQLPYPMRSPASFLCYSLLTVCTLLSILSTGNALPQSSEDDRQREEPPRGKPQSVPGGNSKNHLRGADHLSWQKPLSENRDTASTTLDNLLEALGVMQSAYFELWQGTWPSSIDWTAAVLGTQVSATLSALSWTLDEGFITSSLAAAGGPSRNLLSTDYTSTAVISENLINYYFDQTSAFYFGEDAFAVRNQAYDDMLWVVLEWLENIKFQNLHSRLHYSFTPQSSNGNFPGQKWHGTQFSPAVAHRASLFYELGSQGWDNVLCGGGMIWSPYLTPYKNAITNELFVSASIGMYLYFPGDLIDSPFLAPSDPNGNVQKPHNPVHLEAAVRGYQWLKDSNMTTQAGLYGDGFHISGWHGPGNPGTRKCDVFNSMVFTYNQGVVLSGLRGLWLATGYEFYWDDGHTLVENVIKATGWPDTESQKWEGLGRGGVLEEFCDSAGTCSQNGHTFKGIFFHHLAEFCRPLSPEEQDFLTFPPSNSYEHDGGQVFQRHQTRCSGYGPWIKHNADAALKTRNEEGKIGTWWGRQFPDPETKEHIKAPALPYGAIDYANNGSVAEDLGHLSSFSNKLRGGSAGNNWNNYEGSLPGGWNAESPNQPRSNEERPRKPEGSSFKVDRDVNDRGRGRTVETQSGGVAVLRALYLWENLPSLALAESDEESSSPIREP
jgi:hypothetical protein